MDSEELENHFLFKIQEQLLIISLDPQYIKKRSTAVSASLDPVIPLSFN